MPRRRRRSPLFYVTSSERRTKEMGFISGVDFVMVPVTDFERAKQFYGEVLELEQSKHYGSRPGGEWETGTLTLQIMDTQGFGMERAKPNENPIALHVDDFDGAKAT